MSDLIRREDAIEAVCREICDTSRDKCETMADGNCGIIQRIEALPSAELPKGDLISRADVLKYPIRLNHYDEENGSREFVYGVESVIEYVEALPSADAVPQSEQYKKGFEDAKRAFELEYARESENMRKRNSQLEVMLNAQKAISADAVHGWRIGKPTEQGKYMVTLDSFGHKHIDLFYYGKPMMPNCKVRGMCWYRSDDEWGDVVYDDTDILAWQPLPKPYKGGDTE